MAKVIGDLAPEVSLYDQNNKLRNSKNIKGKPLVLFFYPKDDTPGCTAEVCGFRDKYDLFKVFGAEVWGVSCDSLKSHKDFAKKNELPFPLLSDVDGKLRKEFGVPKFLGIIEGRVTYIIDRKGYIRHIFEDLLNSSKHVNEALTILNQIGSD